jgi:Bifunctional DNA primase/polymerase, N-terminal
VAHVHGRDPIGRQAPVFPGAGRPCAELCQPPLGPLIDIRATGGYVVAPGSRIGRRVYEVANSAPAAPLPGWIASLLDDRPSAAAPARRLPFPGISQATAYALAALREETATVATSRPGTRNDALNRAAFSLGQLVAAGLLPAAAVATALTDAAESCGLPGGEAHRTIRSGMASAARYPRAQHPRPAPSDR